MRTETLSGMGWSAGVGECRPGLANAANVSHGPHSGPYACWQWLFIAEQLHSGFVLECIVLAIGMPKELRRSVG